jgi:hypothetical protein
VYDKLGVRNRAGAVGYAFSIETEILRPIRRVAPTPMGSRRVR